MPRDEHGMAGPERDWAAFDETLADHDAAGPDVPPVAAREWLLQQRFVHGLLRAMNTDAGAREERVRAILGSLEARSGRSGRPVPVVWLLVAAALLMLVLGWLFVPGFQRLPEAHAAVARALEHLGAPVDRRFRLSFAAEGGTAPWPAMRSEFTLTTRPGMRFLLEGELPFGHLRAGCDGTTFWHHLPFGRPVAIPVAEAERFLAAMGDVFDLGYLDIRSMVQRLPEDFRLQVVGRGQPVAGLGPQLRIEATRLPDRLHGRVASAFLLCDEDTGMITRMEVRTEPPSGRGRSVVFEYVGEVELADGAYRVPR